MSGVCVFCEHAVQTLEPPRLATAADVFCYAHEYRNLWCAKAECPACGARYLAWLNNPWERPRGGPSLPNGEVHDLSHLSTFDDEPGDDDLPRWRVERETRWTRVATADGSPIDPVVVTSAKHQMEDA